MDFITDKSHTEVIYENYDRYLHENKNDMSSPSDAIEMLASEGSFRTYISSLTEGLNPRQRATVMAVCEREREFLLEQSSQLGPSANVIGYAVK